VWRNFINLLVTANEVLSSRGLWVPGGSMTQSCGIRFIGFNETGTNIQRKS
jgi:hypothetical protein